MLFLHDFNVLLLEENDLESVIYSLLMNGHVVFLGAAEPGYRALYYKLHPTSNVRPAQRVIAELSEDEPDTYDENKSTKK